MDDPADGMRFEEGGHAVAIGDVELQEAKCVEGRQLRQPRLLEPHIIIVVDIVDAQDAFAAFQQAFGHVKADEARRSCHQRHPVLSTVCTHRAS